MWDLIVSVPDHCLSFYFEYVTVKVVAHPRIIFYFETSYFVVMSKLTYV